MNALQQIPWPLVTEDGHHFIYYLGHWLPPALAASFCPASWAPWLLALWTFLGLELALLAATVRWGIRKTARWALIPPLPRLSGSGAGLPGNSPLLPVCGIPCPDGPVHRHARPTLQHIQSRRSGAIVRRIRPDALPLPPSGYYLAGTLLLPSSPLGALLLLPYMAYETLFRLPAARKPLSRLRSLLGQPVFWLAALCTAVMAVFIPIWTEEGNSPACLMQNMRKSTITGTSGFCSIPIPSNTPASCWPWPWGYCCRGRSSSQNAGKTRCTTSRWA